MDLPRKSMFSLALVLALFGTPALASAQAPGAPGAVGHPPIVQLATLPRRVGLRRRVRGMKLRMITWRLGRRLRQPGVGTSAGSESIRPRLLPRDNYARGPPGSSDR
jgi:hypothetical protein